MSETMSIACPPAFALTAPAMDEPEALMRDADRLLPPGWWLLPSAVLGAGMWVGLALLIL